MNPFLETPVPTDSLRLAVRLPVAPDRLYASWLDAEEHTAFTGAEAEVDARPGGRHSAWDGYIEGTILELDPPGRIVQSWRTAEFPDAAPDSRLELTFEPDGDGTRLTLFHTEIPTGQGARYESGWEEFYFTPMREYFGADG